MDAGPSGGADGRPALGRGQNPGEAPRPTLTAAVRRRRADRAFVLRIASIMRANAAALERLTR